MPRFVYQSTRALEPRPGVTYATVYYKQTPAEHARMQAWFTQVAQDIMQVCERRPDLDVWFSTPLKRFRTSRRGEYYTSERLLTDILGQLCRGNDLPDAMLGRWNRWSAGTEWEIDMTDQAQPTPAFHALFV